MTNRSTRTAAIWLALGAFAPAQLAAQQRITVEPEHPKPGALVRITVADSDVVSVSGRMAGEPLHFVAGRGAHRSIGAVPVDSASVTATVVIVRASGRSDTASVAIELPPLPPPTEQLAVAGRFSRPLDAATAARVARETERALKVARASHNADSRWTAPFRRPRASAVTSTFGTGRTFNGTVASRHLGVDFRGATGAEIRAANRGVVALVDTFFLAGRVVYLDHGGGLTTGYFHMSKPLVRAGDVVERGQVIGLVGATGRVTGPHLHWTARYGAITVNPMELLELEVPQPPQ